MQSIDSKSKDKQDNKVISEVQSQASTSF